MYTEFYGLTKKPFSMTPDPAFLFLTRQHREALAGLTYAVLDRKGFLVMSGQAGSGKTTLLSWVLQKLPASHIQTSIILNPTLTREEFLEMAMLDFGIQDIPASKAQRIWKLQEFLVKGRQAGLVSVLIVDEAHKLTPELLEEVRLLGNFENPDEKLLQILLIGQSELDDMLARADLWQLKQRVSVRLALEPLQSHEVEHYVQHRWRVAGGNGRAPFSSEALAVVASLSQGVPRLINSICDNALMAAMGDGTGYVSTTHVETVGRDLVLTIPAPPAPAAAPVPEAVAAAPVPAAVAVAEAPHQRPTELRLFGISHNGGNSMNGSAPVQKGFLSRWIDRLSLK